MTTMRDLAMKQRQRRKSEEETFHRAVAAYLDLAIRSPDWWTTFPAGGGGKARGGKLKAMGLKPGVPDILVINGTNGVAHWLELKIPAGVESPAQKAMAETIIAARGKRAVCRTMNDVTNALKSWGFHIRARAA